MPRSSPFSATPRRAATASCSSSPAREGGGARAGACSARWCPAGSRGRTFASFVVGFEEAGRRHGGEGALYVRHQAAASGASSRRAQA